MVHHFWLLIAACSIRYVETPQLAAGTDLHCGLWCLFVCLQGLGLPVESLEELEESLGQPTMSGYSMLKLSEAAERFGAKTLPVQTTIQELRRRNQPFACIVRLQKQHFIVLYDLDDTNAYVI